MYSHLILGGTFDHFHKGHRIFLDKAFSVAKKVTIGLATKKVYKHKIFAHSIESYNQRKQNLLEYLKKKNFLKRSVIVRLNDFYGPGPTDQTADSILVTKTTRKGAMEINRLRKENNISQLKIVIAPLAKADGGVISSERIRLGEIDREGNTYQKLFRRTLTLPPVLRKRLRVPLGTVIKGTEKQLISVANKVVVQVKKLKPEMVVAVGDIISMSLKKVGFVPDVSIVDLRSRRMNIKDYLQGSISFFSSASPLIGDTQAITSKKISSPSLNNLSSTISSSCASKLQKLFSNYLQTNKPQYLVIRGEEDLLVLPAVLLAPLGSVVLYGQYDLGVVIVPVTEEKKGEVRKIISRFK